MCIHIVYTIYHIRYEHYILIINVYLLHNLYFINMYFIHIYFIYVYIIILFIYICIHIYV